MRFNTVNEWLDWQESLHPSEIDLGLERVDKVLKQLIGNYYNLELNQFDLPFLLITIGGTNGKGSSVAYLSQILIEAGYVVGTYTSPHFLQYNERIKINGEMISDHSLCEQFEAVDKARERNSLSYFEFGTLAAIHYFVQSKCKIVILEVGLGGRLDAVNALSADCSLITTVDLDHQSWLGDNVEVIGYEKAGIYRTGRPAVFGDENIPKSVIRYAKQIQSDLYQYLNDYYYLKQDNQWSWFNRKGKAIFKNLPLPRGDEDIQIKNISSILMVIYSLTDKLDRVSTENIVDGINHTEITGRLQTLHQQPVVIADVAHNPQSVKVLKNYLKKKTDLRNIAIFSMLADKDIEEVIHIITSSFEEWHLYTLDSQRAAGVDLIADLLSKENQRNNMRNINVSCYNSFFEAYQSILQQMSSTDIKTSRIIVFGSFLTVSDALSYFHESA